MRGGKLRYVDTTEPESYIPDFGEIDPYSLSLTTLADAYGSDKGTIKHNYTSVYERLIEQYTFGQDKNNVELNILEIGIACGASLRSWATYLPKSKITGIDIRETCKDTCDGVENISTVIGDATSKMILGKLGTNSKYDFIIDDGSHISEHIYQSFNLLWPRVKDGGWYIIEDLSCTYNTPYTEEMNKRLGMNFVNSRSTILKLMDLLCRSIDSKSNLVDKMEYHPQLLAIKKREATNK